MSVALSISIIIHLVLLNSISQYVQNHSFDENISNNSQEITDYVDVEVRAKRIF